MSLQAKIAEKRAQLEAERRADLLYQVGYFNESAQWWAAERDAFNTRRQDAACRQAAREAAEASHLSALTLIVLENTP